MDNIHTYHLYVLKWSEMIVTILLGPERNLFYTLKTTHSMRHAEVINAPIEMQM